MHVLKMRGYKPDNPIASLPPSARRILEASLRILERDGFAALTYEAIGAESGQYKDSIRYYFGGKAGLIQVLFDAAIHDTSLRVFAKGRQHPPGVGRVHATIMASRVLPEAPGNLVLWELLPPVLRDSSTRERVAQLYELYRSHYFAVFGVEGDLGRQALVRLYATLLIAALDGLAIQAALDPDSVDLDELFALWADIITESADRRLAAGALATVQGAPKAHPILGEEGAQHEPVEV
jgi:AcrR family transcriptional regulator